MIFRPGAEHFFWAFQTFPSSRYLRSLAVGFLDGLATALLDKAKNGER